MRNQGMTDDEIEAYFVRRLAQNEFARQHFLAKLSCAMTQHGSHIDTLATGERAEPAQNLPAEVKRS